MPKHPLGCLPGGCNPGADVANKQKIMFNHFPLTPTTVQALETKAQVAQTNPEKELYDAIFNFLRNRIDYIPEIEINPAGELCRIANKRKITVTELLEGIVNLY